MTISCEAARELLLESRGRVVDGAPEMREHVASCADCSEHAVRTSRLVAALASMPRASAPRELDGLAVAALHEGHRQDRAVAAVRALGRLSMPRELSGRSLRSRGQVRDSILETEPGITGARAPAVLDRLVDENLRRGSADAGRRFASRLDRLRAPGALRDRIESSVRQFLGEGRARGHRLAAAAAVLLLAGGGLWLSLRAAKEGAFAADFQVRYESNLDAMDPMARAMLGGFSGGLVDAGGRARKP